MAVASKLLIIINKKNRPLNWFRDSFRFTLATRLRRSLFPVGSKS